MVMKGNEAGCSPALQCAASATGATAAATERSLPLKACCVAALARLEDRAEECFAGWDENDGCFELMQEMGLVRVGEHCCWERVPNPVRKP